MNLIRPPKRFLPSALLLLFLGCQATAPKWNASTPLEEGLSHFGTIIHRPAAPAEREIVVLMDRHTLTPGITRERGPIMEVRGQVRDAVEFLLSKDFSFLGCESPLGPLGDDAVAMAHREATRDAIRENDRLNALTIYQPIRLEEELGSRITVFGIEDPDLYSADREALQQIREYRRKRPRSSPSDVALLREAELLLVRGIMDNARPRGEKAAKNLLKLMAERGENRAIMLIGGGHVPAVRSALAREGAAVWVLEPASYRKVAGTAGP